MRLPPPMRQLLELVLTKETLRCDVYDSEELWPAVIVATSDERGWVRVVGRDYRLQITQAGLNALLEDRMADGLPADQTAEADSKNSDRGSPVEAALGREGERILAIANSDNSADDRALAICAVDQTAWTWKSPRWAKLLRVSEGAIRKGRFWKQDRPAWRERQRDE